MVRACTYTQKGQVSGKTVTHVQLCNPHTLPTLMLANPTAQEYMENYSMYVGIDLKYLSMEKQTTQVVLKNIFIYTCTWLIKPS